MSRPELGFEDRVTIGGEGGWPVQERAAGIDKTKGKLEGKPVDLSCWPSLLTPCLSGS